jgi:hypothetical protein
MDFCRHIKTCSELFIEAQYIIAKGRKNSNVYQQQNIYIKPWYISTMKTNELSLYAATWMVMV